MSDPMRQTRFDGLTLLRWCGHAARAGLFAGISIGTAILFR
jgi:hypothetical protein